jgi:hypothetical protein
MHEIYGLIYNVRHIFFFQCVPVRTQSIASTDNESLGTKYKLGKVLQCQVQTSMYSSPCLHQKKIKDYHDSFQVSRGIIVN